MAFCELLLKIFGFLRLKECQIILIRPANRKFDMMGQLYFMAAFTTDEVAGHSIAPVYSYKRLKKFFCRRLPSELRIQ